MSLLLRGKDGLRHCVDGDDDTQLLFTLSNLLFV